MATASAIGTLDGIRTFHSHAINDNSILPGLSRTSSIELAKASTLMSFHPEDLIYTEGEQASGAYLIREGKVKLVATSSDGKALILRIAGPGEIISLSAGLSHRTNDTSALVVEPTTVSYIKAANLYRLMEQFSDVALCLAQELSTEYSLLCQELSSLGLQRSAMSRLAKLLVGMMAKTTPEHGKIEALCPLTHEEIAQMIGTSRETVTRLLHDLRDDGIATLKNDVLTVNKIDALRALTN
ncbi:MAG TPA: Crp/Fnr family transcriptional regulator [Terriglobales bacterium]|nr:Crp/Fnr family transcriptional regulator [Terriglobales bacterium]